MNIWEAIEGFTPTETTKWGNPCQINGLVLLLISALRKAIREVDPQAYVVIHAGWAQDGHSKKSQHYKGNALDFHFHTTMPYDEQVKWMVNALGELQVLNRVGLGIYPDWNSAGFHIDVRGEVARWGYIKGKICGWVATYKHTMEKYKKKG